MGRGAASHPPKQLAEFALSLIEGETIQPGHKLRTVAQIVAAPVVDVRLKGSSETAFAVAVEVWL